MQQDFQFRDDILGRAFLIGLRTVAALQDKRLAALGFGEMLLERIDLPGRCYRWKPTEIRNRPVQGCRVRVKRLLRRLLGLPACGMPIAFRYCSTHGSLASSLVGRPVFVRSNSADYATGGNPAQKFLM